MSRSLSWLDPQALAGSLARAGVGERAQDVRRRAAAAPGAPPRPLTAAPATAAPPPATAAPPPAPEPPPAEFAPPAGTLGERLEAFCAWLAAGTGAQGVFLADQDGLPVVDKQVGDELVAASALITRFLDLAHSRHRALEDRGLQLQLATGELAYFLQDRGEGGRTCLGFVVAEPVGRATLERVRRGLQRALAGEPSGGESR